MDLAVKEAKRRWLQDKNTESKTQYLLALQRAGRVNLLEKLTALWDYEATKVLWDLDLNAMMEASDHLDAVCRCINCITTDQMKKRLEGVGLWRPYLLGAKRYLENFLRDHPDIGEVREDHFIRLLDMQLNSNYDLRQSIVNIMGNLLLEQAA